MDGEAVALRALSSSQPDALWLLDLDGYFAWVNDRALELTGRSREQLIGHPATVLHDDTGIADFDHHLRQMRAGHPGLDNAEVLITRPDGTSRWALCSWWPATDDTGVVVGYLHRLTDYTARRERLDVLLDSERQLAALSREGQLGTWTWEVATNHVWWSDDLYRLCEVDPDTFEPSYQGFLNLIHPDDRDRVDGVVVNAVQRADEYRWEGRMVTGTGRTIWVRGAGEIDRDEDGAALRVRGTSQDVTDLHQLDHAASEATRRLRLLQGVAEASNRSLTLADALVRASDAVRAGSAWQPVCAWVKDPATGELISLTLPHLPGDAQPDPERAAWTWKHQLLDMRTDPAAHGEATLVSMPITDGQGMACVVQMLSDGIDVDRQTTLLLQQICDLLSVVAERERSNRDLSEVRDEAMAASRHKSDFLATMSHEIRTPMNGVIGLTDLLLETDLSLEQRRLAEGLRGSGLTLVTIINDILDISKIESGRLDLEAVPFNVRELIDDTSLVLTGLAQDKDIELVVSCEPAVPHVLVGDPVRLGQVIANLGSNAVKFTEHGEVVIAVRVIASDEDPHTLTLRVEVSDTGIGIAPEAAEGLFDAFTQGDRSTTRSHGGTGLGLAICRQLVTLMGGEIDFTSRPGDTRFWFTCQVGVAPDGGGLKAAPEPPPIAYRRALVVDDSAAAGTAVARQLQAWGVCAHVLLSPSDAVPTLMDAHAAGEAFDVVIIDQVMAGRDGFTLAEAIREVPDLADLPLILLSSTAINPRELTAAGFCCWTPKPVREAHLRQVLSGPADDVAPPERKRPPEPPPVFSLDVLVVEDNAVNQLVATGLLEQLGCRVSVVPHGLAAVAALSPGHRYDLVLMDCRMPLMDGYTATRAIRSRERGGRIPIIAMTASAMAGERDRCLAAGMDDFLTKPVDPAQLSAAVRRWSTAASGQVPEPALPATETAPAATGSAADLPVLDEERVANLSELVKDGVNFFERTRMSFLGRIDDALAHIAAAVDEGDQEQISARAHSLKGSALNLGLARVGAAANALESEAHSESHHLHALLQQLQDALAEGVDALVAANTKNAVHEG